MGDIPIGYRMKYAIGSIDRICSICFIIQVNSCSTWLLTVGRWSPLIGKTRYTLRKAFALDRTCLGKKILSFETTGHYTQGIKKNVGCKSCFKFDTWFKSTFTMYSIRKYKIESKLSIIRNWL